MNKKPYKDNNDVTYEMITTDPYFRTLSKEVLTEVINYMNYNGYGKLSGNSLNNKVKNLIKSWKSDMKKTAEPQKHLLLRVIVNIY
jgi:hypothetical protein